jgi:hypothetical protein
VNDSNLSSVSDFTVDGYKNLLESLTARRYEPRLFGDNAPIDRQVILRHDLDMSVDAAVPIAEVEHDLGMAATYFVLLRTEMYNAYSKRARELLMRIAGLGHEIGLHLDASLYGDTADELDAAATSECEVLEAIVGDQVKVVSFHRPAPSLQGLDRTVGGRQHTYQPAFFTDIAYCSDSRGAWHHSHPLELAAVAAGKPFQLLTHPIWWNVNADEGVRQKLDRFALSRFDLLRSELAANCDAYPQEFRALGPGTTDR